MLIEQFYELVSGLSLMVISLWFLYLGSTYCKQWLVLGMQNHKTTNHYDRP
jgi:hypothetical protein